MEVLRVKNISKSIKNKQIINEISFNISEGQIVGLLGPNGAGKTTTFYSILGLVKIDISSDNIEIKEGKIEFKNNVIFRSDSFEIFGEVAEYNRNSELIKIKGSPVRFKIDTEDNTFNGFSNLVIIKDDEIEISGSVLIEDQNSRIRGKIIKFNMRSGELQINWYGSPKS